MNRMELVRRITTVMRENNIRKPITMPKQVFHISDDDGNKKDFIIRKTDKDVLFSVRDVEAVIDTCIRVIADAIQHGEEVSIRGFGTLGVQYRKPRALKHVETGEATVAEARYVPKFYSGNDLRIAAKLYGISVEDKGRGTPLPVFSAEDGDM